MIYNCHVTEVSLCLRKNKHNVAHTVTTVYAIVKNCTKGLKQVSCKYYVDSLFFLSRLMTCIKSNQLLLNCQTKS
jgi:hypothetical protein